MTPTMIDPSQFLGITRANRRQFAATAPGGIYPNFELPPILRGSTGYLGWGTSHKFLGPKPVGDLIPRSEWPSMITAGAGMKTYNAMLANGVKAKDQNGLNYCWAFGSTRAVEYRRLLEGCQHVELSPESVGGPVTGWRNVGNNASDAFEQLQTAGACEASYLDKPCSLHYRNWKAGWQDNAKTHEDIDWYNLPMGEGNAFDQTITLLLQDNPVAAGIDWWGHLICFTAPVLLQDGTVGVLFQNSWGVDWPTSKANGLAILDEDSATPDGAASPILTVDAPVTPPGPGPAPLPDPSL